MQIYTENPKKTTWSAGEKMKGVNFVMTEAVSVLKYFLVA